MKIEFKSRQSIVDYYLDLYRESEMPKQIQTLLYDLMAHKN